MAQRDDTLFRGTLVWEPTDTISVTGKYTHVEGESEGIEQGNSVIDPSLLVGFQAGQNQLGLTDVMGAIAAFAVPGYGPTTGTKDWESWTANPGFNDIDTEDSESDQASLLINWDLDNYTFTSLTGYTGFEHVQDHDTDFHPGRAVHNLDEEDLDTWSQEFRLASNYSGRFNFSAGLYYEEQDLEVTPTPFVDGTLGGVFGQLPANALNPALPEVPLSAIGINSLWNGQVLAALNPVFAPLIGAEQDVIWRDSANFTETETLALFAEVTIDLTDDLFLDLGARYSEDTKETHKQVSLGVGFPGQELTVFNPDGSATGALDPQNSALVAASWAVLNTFPQNNELKREEDHFDPSIRLRWDVTADTMAYVSYTTGYKSGGFNASADTSNPDGSPGPGTEFEDETAEAWELGTKSTLWDGRARLSATLFRTEIEDQQVTSFRGASFLVSNAAKLISQGVELETQVALSDSWEVGGALAYLDAEYDEYPGAPCSIFQAAEIGDSCTQDLSGVRGPYAPEWSGNVYASFEHPLGDNMLFRMSVDANYKDEHYLDGDLDPNVLQDSYWKVNGAIGLSSASGTWDLSLYGRNLTDEATHSFALDAPLSAGLYAAWAEEPRVLGLQARYNF